MTWIIRSIAIALIVVFTLPLTGCWNRRELNTIGIIGMIGVDNDETGVKSTFEIIKPEKSSKDGGTKSEMPVKYVQVNGRNLIETLRKAPLKFDRKLFVSHAKGFLFSEELARNGLADNLDAILRDHEMRLAMHIVIVKDASAADVMGITSGINTIPSNYIEDLIKQSKVHSLGVNTTVLDFLKAYTDKGINPVVTVVKKVKKEKIGAEKSEEFELSIEGAAVFLQDRLIGFLDGQETKGYNFITGNFSSGIITFPTPDNSGGFTSLEVFKATSKKTVELTENEIKLKVLLNINCMLDEQTSNINLTDPKVVKMLEQSANQAVSQDVKLTLVKVQKEYKSDIFGFGQIVHRRYPQEWKVIQDNWNELFSQATVEVETKTIITKKGKSSNPVQE